MTGVHGLEHIQSLGSAALADDDAVGSHAQRIFYKVAGCDRVAAFCICNLRLAADDMRLLQFELCGIFDGNDTLI